MSGLLRRGAKVNVRDLRPRRNTPLHLACARKQPLVAKLLIEAGAKIEALAEGGQTPLFWATCGNNPRVVRLLLEQGARVGVICQAGLNSGKTPLHVAAEYGMKEIAQALVAGGAELNVRDYDGKTPLDMARQYRRSKVAEMLKEAGGRASEGNPGKDGR